MPASSDSSAHLSAANVPSSEAFSVNSASPPRQGPGTLAESHTSMKLYKKNCHHVLHISRLLDFPP